MWRPQEFNTRYFSTTNVHHDDSCFVMINHDSLLFRLKKKKILTTRVLYVVNILYFAKLYGLTQVFMSIRSKKFGKYFVSNRKLSFLSPSWLDCTATDTHMHTKWKWRKMATYSNERILYILPPKEGGYSSNKMKEKKWFKIRV